MAGYQSLAVVGHCTENRGREEGEKGEREGGRERKERGREGGREREREGGGRMVPFHSYIHNYTHKTEEDV